MLEQAKNALGELHDYVVAHHEHLDLTRVSLLASVVQTKLEAAAKEIAEASCDIETSLNRI